MFAVLVEVFFFEEDIDGFIDRRALNAEAFRDVDPMHERKLLGKDINTFQVIFARLIVFVGYIHNFPPVFEIVKRE